VNEAVTRTVMQLARDILSEHELDEVLRRVLAGARELTDARYAALGVLDDERVELSRFLTMGLGEDAERQIGPRPRGHGVLGELIRDPVPLRVAAVSAHPHSYGFPHGHPEMESFLGVPIFVGGVPFGNLYLTDKADAKEFTEADEEAVVLLAEFAGLAIDHARRFGGAEERGERLQRTVDALDATVTISRTLAAQTDLDLILDLVAKRGRALVSARALLIELEEAGELIIAATAGEVPEALLGARLKVADSLAGASLLSSAVQRLDSDANRARFFERGLGSLGLEAEAGLFVPLMLRGRSYGALVALDRLDGGPDFSERDLELLESFAASAAVAVATARSVDAERRRERVAAAEAERSRLARSLNDGAIQNLTSVLGSLAEIAEAGAPRVRELAGGAARRLSEELAGLRALVTELRPAALDELGIEASLEDLAEQTRRRGIEVDLSVDLALERGRADRRLDAELQSTVYRIVQDALQNTVDHASAGVASVTVVEEGEEVRVVIVDDGDGFDSAASERGGGLRTMEERIELLSGRVEIESEPGSGTEVRAALPARRGAEGSGPREG
jgi:two-component system, NarL family, sensor histidine kinase DevS